MSQVILRVRNKDGSTRVSLPAASTLNDLICELRTRHKIDVKPEELYWDLGGSSPVLGGEEGVEESAPLASFNLTHGCLVYVRQHRSASEQHESKDSYISLKGLPPPPVDDYFSSHEKLHSLDEAHDNDSKDVRAPDSVQRMTLMDDAPAPTDSLSAAYALYDQAMEEQITKNALELGMTEWEMQLEIQRLRDERLAQRMQAEMLLENFGSLEDDMDEYLRDVDGDISAYQANAGGRGGKQGPRRRSRGKLTQRPTFREEEEGEGDFVDTEALIKRMDSLLGTSGSGNQRKQKAADAKHAPSGAKSTQKTSDSRSALEEVSVTSVKGRARIDTAAGSKSLARGNASEEWNRKNKGRSNSFDVLQEDDAVDGGEGDEDYLYSQRLQREERDLLDALKLQQQLQEEEDAALAQEVHGQQSPNPQSAVRAPLADIPLPQEEDESSFEQLEQQQRLFFQRREVERERMRDFIGGVPRALEPFQGTGAAHSLDSSLDETILSLALAHSTIPSRPSAIVRLDSSDDDDDLAKAIRESLKYK